MCRVWGYVVALLIGGSAGFFLWAQDFNVLTLEGKENAVARAPALGTVVQVAVEAGQPVTRGQTLATLQNTRDRIQLVALTQRVAALKAASQKAEDEVVRLRGTRAAPAQEHATTTMARLQTQWANAEAQRLHMAARVGPVSLTAPWDGVVLRMNLVTDSMVAPGGLLVHVGSRPLQFRVNIKPAPQTMPRVGDTVWVNGFSSAPARRPRQVAAVSGSILWLTTEVGDEYQTHDLLRLLPPSPSHVTPLGK